MPQVWSDQEGEQNKRASCEQASLKNEEKALAGDGNKARLRVPWISVFAVFPTVYFPVPAPLFQVVSK